jgi:Fic family protein
LVRDLGLADLEIAYRWRGAPLLRLHHQLPKIHPFANGNGRHARLIADIVVVKCGQSEFTWGAGKDLVAEGDARTHYLAALRTLDANENDVKLLLEFARS